MIYYLQITWLNVVFLGFFNKTEKIKLIYKN